VLRRASTCLLANPDHESGALLVLPTLSGPSGGSYSSYSYGTGSGCRASPNPDYQTGIDSDPQAQRLLNHRGTYSRS
jgi:hypothetical protein